MGSLGNLKFGSQENGFIGESKFTSSSARIRGLVESALRQAEDNIDKKAENNINRFHHILKLLIQAKLFLQPIKLFQVAESSFPFLNPILYLNKVSPEEIERQIENLFEIKEDVKILIHIASPEIPMESENLKCRDILIDCQSLVTLINCTHEMVDTTILEEIS
jgi:hypothetical protein